MKYINLIVLTAFLGPLLVGCSSDTSSGGGSSITLNRGGGEERAAASAETSTSSSDTTSTASTGVYEAYVDRYPDLLAHYTSSGGGQTKSAFGQTHYCAFGKSEGRTIDASVDCTTTADTSTSTTTADTSTTTTTSTDNPGATQVSNTAPITPGGQQEFALSKVNWLHTNVASWPVTHNLTVNLGGGTICMEWGGTATWPTATIRHTDGTRDIKVNANPWVFVWRNGAWYGGTWEWMTPNGNCKPMRVVEGGHIKRPPLTNWTPASGETLYFMVSSLARAGNLNNYQARTNVVRVVWP